MISASLAGYLVVKPVSSLIAHSLVCSAVIRANMVPTIASVNFTSFNILANSRACFRIAGIGIGHIYYFLEDVFPNQQGGFKILRTPSIM